MAQYSYPGNDQRYDPPTGNRRKYKSCAPSRSGKSKLLEWTVFSLFALNVLCQFLTQLVSAGVLFWWLGLGDDVLVFLFILFLITR